MNIALQKDIGAHIHAVLGGLSKAATAGGSGDNTAENGFSIDLRALPRQFHSAKLVVAYEAALAEGETLSLTALAQDASVAAHASGAATFGSTFPKAVVATGGAGGSTESGVIELNFDISGSRDYLRSVVTPDLSRANTDTCRFVPVWIFGGANELPVA